METKVWSLGSSECGQSGLKCEGENEKLFNQGEPILKVPRELTFFRNLSVIGIVCGGMHTLAITQCGELYSWGCNDEGALGRLGDEEVPIKVQLPDIVRQVSAGDSHSLAIIGRENERSFYLWGCYRDANGQMTDVIKEPIKKECVSGEYPWQIASGRDSANGKLARKPSPYHNFKQKCLEIRPCNARFVQGIWAFGQHSFIQTFNKNVSRIKAFGLNHSGQLGLPKLGTISEPMEILELKDKKVQKIVGGEFHALFLIENGEVYVSGQNDIGQIGLGEEIKAIKQITKLDMPNKESIKQIASGSQFSYAVHKSGAYSWGEADNFVLGNKKETSQYLPIPFDMNLLENQSI